jgi:hypothetical protein
MDLAAQAMGQRVIDCDQDGCPARKQPLADQHRQSQPQLVGIPARVTEKAMRTTVMPHPRESSTDEHPRDRPQPGLGDLARHQRPEGLEARTGKARREQEQQFVQRRWQAEHRRRTSVASRGRASRPPTAISGLQTPTASGKPPMLLPRTPSDSQTSRRTTIHAADHRPMPQSIKSAKVEYRCFMHMQAHLYKEV